MLTRLRILLFLSTFIVVGFFGYFGALYARGYRFDTKTFKFLPNGLMVIKSNPTGAQIFINGELRTATDATISITPGVYDVEVKKEGYASWQKRLTVEKEIVTEATAFLFKTVPSLSAISLTGAENPVVASELNKIAFVVPSQLGLSNDKIGLWILETLNLPIGFPKDPRRITDGDLKGATYLFSPDAREILLTTSNGVFLLDTGEFISQSQRVNVAARKDEILADWEKEKQLKVEAQVRRLPEELSEVLLRRTQSVHFSPDDNMILYTASSEAKLASGLIKKVPGASTQPENRDIEVGHTYVYDIKEDRNFLIDNGIDKEKRINWFPTSRHLVVASIGKVEIIDYDATNRQAVYTGSYLSPHAYPFGSTDKLLVLTNLGGSTQVTNLYSLNIR